MRASLFTLAMMFVPAITGWPLSFEQLPDYRVADPKLTGTLVEDGSGAMDKLVVATTREFARIYPEVTITTGFGSSAAVAPGLMKGIINLGAMSRPFEPAELDDFKHQFGHPPLQIEVARDAIEILVHHANPLPGLTLAQLDAIFSTTRRRGTPGDITTWGQLGLTGKWADRAITMFGGGPGWGTTRTFRQLVLLDGDFKPNIIARDVMTGVADEISGDEAAIGYAVVRERDKELRQVPLAVTNGAAYVRGTLENISTGDYPLQRSLYFYLNADPVEPITPVVAEFLRFVLSRQGQALILRAGYVPLSVPRARRERAKLTRPTPAKSGLTPR